MDVEPLLKEYRERWNVPDWRIKENYLYVKELEGDRHRLRWEFLRRMPYYRSDWDEEESLGNLDFGLRVNVAPSVRGDALPADFEFMDSTAIGEILISGPKVLDDFDQLFSGYTNNGTENSQTYEEYARSLGERMIFLAKAGYVLVPF